MKDLSSLVLQTWDRSNLAETISAKPIKALQLSEQLLEPMLTSSSLTTSKREAFARLEPSPTTLVTLIDEGFCNSVLGVSYEDILARAKRISYLFLLFRALMPPSSSSPTSFSSTRTGLFIVRCGGDPIDSRGTPVVGSLVLLWGGGR